MKNMISVLLLVFAQLAQASEVPKSFTFQGKIFKANGIDPLESAAVSFKIQVRSPDGLCLLFEETHLRNMTGTSGIFTLIIGQGTNSNATALQLQQVFDNSATLAGASCSYIPVSGDSRRLRLTYDDGVEVVSIPTDQTINSVPYALNALTLQGATKSSFIQVSPEITQARAQTLFTSFTDLMSLANGTSALYAKSTDLPLSGGVLNLSSGGVRVPDAPASVDSAVNKNYADTKVAGRNVDLTGLANGQTMVWNSALSKWQVGTISLPAVGTAGTYTKVTTDIYGRVSAGTTLSESDIPSLVTAGKVSGAAITSGAIAGTTSVNTSGAITTTGTVTAANVVATAASSQSLKLYETTNAHRINLLAPAALAVDFSLVLPTTAGTSGQVLSTDGSGNLSWASASGMSGSAGGDLSGTYPNPSVSKISGTSLSISSLSTGNYLKYNGTNWVNASIVGSDVTTALGYTPINSSQMPASCASNQTLTFSSPTGTWNCSSISVSGSAFGSQSANLVLASPNGSAGNPTFRGLAAADLPTSGVTAGTYTSMTVDTYGRVTAGTNPAVVTSVAAGTGLTGGTITSTGTLNVDVGTAANKIVQLDASARLPAVDGSQLSGLPIPFSNMQVFDSSGTFNVPSDVKKVYVQVWGGGGGGGGGTLLLGGGGGGAGAYGSGFLTVTSSSAISVTVGAPGTSGAAGAVGGNGGTTTFSSVNATGGVGGGTAAGQSPSAGGTATAVLGVAGSRGTPGLLLATVTTGGTGGSAPGGGGSGGIGAGSGSTTGTGGVLPGGGGGGGGGTALSSTTAGGTGGGGRVIVWY